MSVRLLFENSKREIKQVDIKGLGKVNIRKLSLKQRIEMSSLLSDSVGKNLDVADKKIHMAMVEVIKMAVCEENGDVVFTDSDNELLLEKDGEIISDLSTAILEHNGLVEDDSKELAKN